jgi:hypothetical protein
MQHEIGFNLTVITLGLIGLWFIAFHNEAQIRQVSSTRCGTLQSTIYTDCGVGNI